MCNVFAYTTFWALCLACSNAQATTVVYSAFFQEPVVDNSFVGSVDDWERVAYTDQHQVSFRVDVNENNTLSILPVQFFATGTPSYEEAKTFTTVQLNLSKLAEEATVESPRRSVQASRVQDVLSGKLGTIVQVDAEIKFRFDCVSYRSRAGAHYIVALFADSENGTVATVSTGIPDWFTTGFSKNHPSFTTGKFVNQELGPIIGCTYGSSVCRNPSVYFIENTSSFPYEVQTLWTNWYRISIQFDWTESPLVSVTYRLAHAENATIISSYNTVVNASNIDLGSYESFVLGSYEAQLLVRDLTISTNHVFTDALPTTTTSLTSTSQGTTSTTSNLLTHGMDTETAETTQSLGSPSSSTAVRDTGITEEDLQEDGDAQVFIIVASVLVVLLASGGGYYVWLLKRRYHREVTSRHDEIERAKELAVVRPSNQYDAAPQVPRQAYGETSLYESTEATLV